jgi:hypothetical protein
MTEEERRADAAAILVRRLAEEDSHFRALPAGHRSPVQQRHHAMMVLSAINFFLKIYDRHQIENIVIAQMIETFQLANEGKVAPMAYVPGRKELKESLARSREETEAHAAALLEYAEHHLDLCQKHWAKKIAEALAETGYLKSKREKISWRTVRGWREKCNERSHSGTYLYINALDWWANDPQRPSPEWILEGIQRRAMEVFGPKSERDYLRRFDAEFEAI